MRLEKILDIMDTLLGENGCPWDKAQTHDSLRLCLIEECNEVIEAIDSHDMDSLKEELGDVLLQVVFHAKLAERAGVFNINDVLDGLADKLIRRHTHIFGADKAVSAEDAMRIWSENKAKEKEAQTKE